MAPTSQANSNANAVRHSSPCVSGKPKSIFIYMPMHTLLVAILGLAVIASLTTVGPFVGRL